MLLCRAGRRPPAAGFIYTRAPPPGTAIQMQRKRSRRPHDRLPTIYSTTPSTSITINMAEVHSSAPAVAKRMWSYLRAVFLMARKGLLSNKRRLLLTMHLLAKRRGGINKAVARTVTALLHSSHSHGAALRRRDYEFSCTNSPAAAADPGSSSSSRRRLAYIIPSCLGADDYAAPPQTTLDRIDYNCYYAASPSASASPELLMRDLAPGEEEDEYDDDDEDQCCGAGASPDLLLAAAAGRFSVRVSNYSSDDEAGASNGGEAVVDRDAEEFIRRFYDQLRRQNAVAMLPYLHECAAA